MYSSCLDACVQLVSFVPRCVVERALRKIAGTDIKPRNSVSNYIYRVPSASDSESHRMIFFEKVFEKIFEFFSRSNMSGKCFSSIRA